MSIPVGSMFVVYNSFMMSSQLYEDEHILSSFASLLIMLLINILIFNIYRKLSEDLELRRKNAVYKQEIGLYSKHIEEKANAMFEFRKAKHDLKNQLIYLLELSESQEYEELKSFLEKLIVREPFDGFTIANTDNSVIDALVNYKYGIAKRYGIEFKAKLDVPTQLTFDDIDLCIILGNALDNAIEANLRTDVKNPYIKLYIKLDKGNLIIIIENSFDGYMKKNRHGRILTMKKDVEEHGIGLSSIQKSVDRYHGFLETDIKEQKFRLRIVLYEDREKLRK